ncbi:MAG: type II toxin-antitoxin system Phd/YefM family antitoxin [Coriobacteriales bacterium]|nr:type II toxin-antitoxin system Phd/YefM family antitoxin [Coriobacteriales bacterium]
MQTKPVSELHNHYADIEEAVASGGPVLLTKDGRGSMVVMSIEQYERLAGDVEAMLDAADRQASSARVRYSHEEVFGALREELHSFEAVV